jgi:hypothetical protein
LDERRICFRHIPLALFPYANSALPTPVRFMAHFGLPVWGKPNQSP